MRVLGSNVAVDGGEIDLCALDGAARVVVEVRAITGDGDPIDAIGSEKRKHVESLAIRFGAERVDFVGVRLGASTVDVHWLPGDGPIGRRKGLSSRR